VFDSENHCSIIMKLSTGSSVTLSSSSSRLESTVDGKRGKIEMKRDYGDLTYTAKINFK